MADHLKAVLESTLLLHPTEIGDDKTCPVCYETYLQQPSCEFPRKLRCGHIIGTECLLLWASSHDLATAIKCPWCRWEIVPAVDAKQVFKMVLLTYAERALVGLAAQVRRMTDAVDRALVGNQLGLIVFACVLVAPAIYFDCLLAWLPFLVLDACVYLACRSHLGKGRGLCLIVLGLCVATFVDWEAGRVLFRWGVASFSDTVEKAFDDYTALVFAVFAVLVAVLVSGKASEIAALYVVTVDVGMEFFLCGFHKVLRRVVGF